MVKSIASQLLMATVEEDLYELTLTASFTLKSSSDIQRSAYSGRLTASHAGNFLSSLMDDTDSIATGSATSIGRQS